MDESTRREMARTVPREVHRDARLFSYNLATIVKGAGGAYALRIPTAVSDNSGGRETVYELPQNEKTLMAMIVFEDLVRLEFFTRTSDTTYVRSIERPTGEVIWVGEGELEVINEAIGFGRVRFTPTEELMRETPDYADPNDQEKLVWDPSMEGWAVWIWWSSVLVTSW
jgi:hypothetical protein